MIGNFPAAVRELHWGETDPCKVKDVKSCDHELILFFQTQYRWNEPNFINVPRFGIIFKGSVLKVPGEG